MVYSDMSRKSKSKNKNNKIDPESKQPEDPTEPTTTLTIEQLSRESSRDYIRKNERVTYLDE